MLDIGVVSSLF